MRLRYLGSMLLLLGLCGSNAWSQGCIVRPYYSTLATESWDGSYLSTSVQTSGYADMGCPSVCCIGALHQPWALNQISTPDGTVVTGGWQAGNSAFPADTISVVNYQAVPMPIPNDNTPPEYIWSWDGKIVCNKVGVYWQAGHEDNDVEEAITYAQNTHIACGYDSSGRVNCVDVDYWCTAESVFPDYLIAQVSVVPGFPSPPDLSSNYFNALTNCSRPHNALMSTKWKCFDPTPYVVAKSDTAKHTCTNKDRGTKGRYPDPN